MNGGAMYNVASSPRIINSIFWGDLAGTAVSEIANSDTTRPPTVSSSSIQGGYPRGENLLDMAPLWDRSHDLRPTAYTPPEILNGGDTTVCPPTDINGFPRALGTGACSMGAHEPPCLDSLEHPLSFDIELLRIPERDTFYTETHFTKLTNHSLFADELPSLSRYILGIRYGGDRSRPCHRSQCQQDTCTRDRVSEYCSIGDLSFPYNPRHFIAGRDKLFHGSRNRNPHRILPR